MSGPTISVITVTRNLIEAGRRQSILDAMECVQNQTCRDLEHVIWDGASTDGTQDLITGKIAEIETGGGTTPIRFHSEPDSGLYDAMNKAVDACRGDYVVFLNSDDLLAENTILADLVDMIGSDQPDFIFGGTLQTLADGSVKEFTRTNLSAFLQRMPFCHNSMIVKRSVFQSLGGHDLSLRVASDYDFVFRMLVAGHTAKNARRAISRYTGRGVSNDSLGVGRDYAQVWSRHFSNLTGQDSFDVETCLEWYRVGQLPPRICIAALRSAKNNTLLRRAALHSLKITLRRRLQPWRKWDNLKV